MVKPLGKTFATIFGAPTIHSVDSDIFEKRYFAHCMECGFCHDACCQFGADVDVRNVLRIEGYAQKLAMFLSVPASSWFDKTYSSDSEFPGGAFTRTSVRGRSCVFHARTGKGCELHRFSVEYGFDYHDLKPMVCCLFPLTFDNGVLHCADEIEDASLVCGGEGPTLYRGVRQELLYYFGSECVSVLDGLEVGQLVAPSM
jgi:Fe-S-cluster containining protein